MKEKREKEKKKKRTKEREEHLRNRHIQRKGVEKHVVQNPTTVSGRFAAHNFNSPGHNFNSPDVHRITGLVFFPLLISF